MRRLEVPASPQQRAISFLEAYMAASDDADIEIMGGKDANGAPAMVIRLDGALHGFTVVEARKLADVAESTMRKFDEARTFGNLILAIRAAADQLDSVSKSR